METQPVVKIAALSFIAFLLIILLAILIAGQYDPTVRGFRNRMITKWKPALGIAGLFLLGIGIGGRGFINPYAIAVFARR